MEVGETKEGGGREGGGRGTGRDPIQQTKEAGGSRPARDSKILNAFQTSYKGMK